MGKAEERVRISFERGKMNNGWWQETKLFQLSFKKQKRVKPDSITKESNRKNIAQEDFNILLGVEHRVFMRRIKGNRDYHGEAIFTIEQKGEEKEVIIKDWKGKFCPTISLA